MRLGLVLGIALIQSILLVILVLTGSTALESSSREQLAERSRAIAERLAHATEDAVIASDLTSLEAAIEAILSDPEVVYARIRGEAPLLVEGWVPSLLERPFREDQGAMSGDEVCDVQAVILAGGRRVGVVEIGVSTSGITRVLARAGRWTGAIAVAEVVLVVLLSYVLATLLTRRLQRLQCALEEVAGSGPGLQIPATGHGELASVAESFNRMSGHLADSYTRLTEALDVSRQRARSAARHAAILSASLDAILTFDAEGRIVDCHGNAERMFGYAAAELLGSPVAPTLIPDLLPGLRERDAASALMPEAGWTGNRRLVLCARHKDGHAFPIELDMAPIETEDGRLFTSFIRDISERQETEASLDNARRLAEAASEAKSRFLATMSHEIRTPLNSIINMNNLLLESPLDAEQQQFASAAVNGGQLLLALLNNVLDFSKIEAGKLTLERQWLRTIDTVNTVASLFSAEAHAKGIEILVVTAAGLPGEYFGDLLRIKQILTNLVGNAIKFTDSGGVVIRLDYLAAVADQPGRMRLEVADTGIGIPETQQALLFEEFVQADDSPTRRYQGTGLGLTISQRLIEMMGGSIRCASRQGAGTCFGVEIPAAARGEHDAELGAVLAQLRQTLVLLYCENAVLRDGLAEQLDRYGIASQGLGRQDELDRYLHGLDDQRNVLVVLDTPATGSEQTAYVKALPGRFPALRFVRLVPLNEVGAIDASKRLGFRSVVRKPARLHSLLIYLAEALREAAPARPRAVAAVQPIAGGERAGRILLVEDTPSNVAVATAILEKAHHKVVVAWSGEEALEVVEEMRFGLILMDVSMPMMDGLEATRRIRRGNSPNRDTPIIAMTANAFAEDRERCLQAGMNDFIPKPIDIRNLRRTIQHWLARQTPRVEDERPEQRPEVRAEDVPLFDPAPIERLAANTSQALLPRLIGLFLDEAAEHVSELQQGHASADFPALARHAHSLKSGAGTFGALQLQRLAQHIEQAASREDRAGLATAIDSLGALAASSFAAIGHERERRLNANHA